MFGAKQVAASLAIVLAVAVSSYGQAPSCTLASQELTIDRQACVYVNGDPATEETVGPALVETCCPDLTSGAGQVRRMLGIKEPEQQMSVTGRSLQSADQCRSVTVADAWCDPDETACTAAGSSILLQFAFVYETVTSNDLCCQECGCEGDPRCTALDGSRDQWIICDDREPDTCLHKNGRCVNTVDHLGQQCEFVRRTRNPDQVPPPANPWLSWDVNGSPCQSTAIYDSTGPMPTMKMYETATGETYDLELGERGVITKLTITQADGGTLTLASADCVADAGSSSNPWQISSSSISQIPNTWTETVISSTKTQWSIQTGDLSAFIGITCDETTDTRSRLDIAIREFGTATAVDGYCATGSISEKAGTSKLTPTEADLCLRQEIGGCIEACRALTNNAQCNDDTLNAEVQGWCEFNDLSNVRPAFTDGGDSPAGVAECVARIYDNSNCTGTSENWADIVCQIDNRNSNGDLNQDKYDQCMAFIAEFTWWDYVSEERGDYEVNVPMPSLDPADGECETDATNYGDKPDDCSVGAEMQYFDESSGEWISVFFIPVERPPCDTALNLNGADFPELMTNPIRLVQCESLQTVCNNENNCLPTNGFQVTFNFNTEECRTDVPTGAPTPTPSCYTCVEEPDSKEPKICEFGDDFKKLGECEQCCEAPPGEFVPPLTPEGLCRTQETDVAYCTGSGMDNELGVDCDDLTQNNKDALLEIRIQYEVDAMPAECCMDCTAYGDPELSSFTDPGLNDLSVWVLCDGRVDLGSRCEITKEQCEAELDHTGANCVYNQTLADMLVEASDIGALGSPCQVADPSNPAVQPLYEPTGVDFSVKVTLGERAVVTDTHIMSGGDEFVLNSQECFSGSGEGWSKNGTPIGVDELGNTFENIVFDSTTVRNGERTWQFTDTATGVFMQVTCIEMTATGSGVEGLKGYRSNVDHLIERDEDRALSGDAFCSTNAIDFQGSTPTDVSPGSVFAECTWNQWSTGLQMCKAVWKTSCTSNQIEKGVNAWCQTANVNIGNPNGVSKCINDILGNGRLSDNKIGENWARQYCIATKQSPVNACVNAITDSLINLVDVVDMFGDGSQSSENTCLNNPTYGLSDDVCEAGIFVEYFDGAEWVEELFIPATGLPCSGVVELEGTDHINLFTNPIRFRQCQQVADNGCDMVSSCMPAQGFELSYKFSQRNVCPSQRQIASLEKKAAKAAKKAAKKAARAAKRG